MTGKVEETRTEIEFTIVGLVSGPALRLRDSEKCCSARGIGNLVVDLSKLIRKMR